MTLSVSCIFPSFPKICHESFAAMFARLHTILWPSKSVLEGEALANVTWLLLLDSECLVFLGAVIVNAVGSQISLDLGLLSASSFDNSHELCRYSLLSHELRRCSVCRFLPSRQARILPAIFERKGCFVFISSCWET